MANKITGDYTSKIEEGKVTTEVEVVVDPSIEPFPVDPANEVPSYDTSMPKVRIDMPNYGSFLGYGIWDTENNDSNTSLIDQIVNPDTSFSNILSTFPASNSYFDDLKSGLMKYEDVRYGALLDSMIKNNRFADDMNAHLVNGYNRLGKTKLTLDQLIQFLADMRVWRWNLLDNPLSFRNYMSIVTSILGNIKVPLSFPVLINRLTINRIPNLISASVPYSTSNNESIGWVTQTDDSGKWTATIQNKTGNTSIVTRQLVANLVTPTGTTDDLLITPGTQSVKITKCGGGTTSIDLNYQVQAITGTRLGSITRANVKDKPLFGQDSIDFDGSANDARKEEEYITTNYFIVYLMADYAEHALIFDCADSTYKLLEDTITLSFPEDIVNLLDPKTKIFRDAYQYYVNDRNENTWKTFTIQQMLDDMGNYVDKFTIEDCNLDEPRAITITHTGPRINANVGNNTYFRMYGYGKRATLLNLLPAYGVSFSKAYFFNPREYLTNSDYDEACIPIHGEFKHSHVMRWQSDVQYSGYYNSFGLYNTYGSYLGGSGWYNGWWDGIWGVPGLYLGLYPSFFW